LLLSIDTSAGTSAAVFDGDCLSFVSFEDPFGHAENVGLAIEQALIEAGISIEQVSAIAVGRGPAPYTGLRVGMAAATALSKARSIPLHGVVTLDAIAHSVGNGSVLVTTDAKRRELFAATYRDGRCVDGPLLLTESDLKSYTEFELIQISCDAKLVGAFAQAAIASGSDLSNLSALYLRSPDVTPSAGKKVSG
jgi:tRNA threonylcarbamoyl adenosine modification protein YeaZ